MWKYVSRRIKDTVERGAAGWGCREARGADTGDARRSGGAGAVPSSVRDARRCWAGCDQGSNTNRNWYFSYLNQSWLGAITWSSALALGWYATQLIHLKKKYRVKNDSRHSPLCSIIQQKVKPFLFSVESTPTTFDHSIIDAFINNDEHLLPSKESWFEKKFQKFVPASDNYNFEQFVPSNDETKSYPIHLISNDHRDKVGRESVDSRSSTSSNDLSDVLNSIENKLGLAAIEGGKHGDGLSLLRSAANRHHPPALYNLALCYELGLGIPADEKMAMQLYRIAATLEHPGALYNLAIYYGQGRGGLPKDADTATRLLRLAAVKGQEDAVEALKTISPEKKNDEKWQPNQLEQQVESLAESWTNNYEAMNKEGDIAPTQTSLFLECINSALSTSELRSEGAAY